MMYLPPHFEQNNPQLLLEVMQRYSFATLISTLDGAPFATHIPVLTRMIDGAVQIEGHMARANPHWRALQNMPQALVIFHGPHTYISPTLFKSKNRVPTWNYIAVHASGVVTLQHTDEAKLALLASLVGQQEPAYEHQFTQIDDDVRNSLLGAIVGFTLRVQTLEGKFKLGQHRLADDKAEMQQWHESGGENEQALAQWMKRLGYWQ